MNGAVEYTDDLFNQMVSGAMNALTAVLSLKEKDEVLIITDKHKAIIGEAFKQGAESLGGLVSLYQLPESMRPLTTIPSDLNVDGYDIILNIFEGFAEETPFRIKLSTLEMKNGARVGHAPGITVDMMVKGPMCADYRQIAADAFALINALKGAKKAHITAPSGTNILLDIEGRDFETDTVINKGNIGNLPAGEIWCAPVEDAANGIIVVDGSIGDLGPVSHPLTIVVKSGRAITIKSEDKALLRLLNDYMSVDDMAKVIGEMGIGLNPNARLTGNLLEDEKAGGTAHIAFGNNIDMPGGRNSSATHRDFLFYSPTIDITYKNGEKRRILQDGKITL